MTTKVVVTGIGLVTPSGNSAEELWRNVAGGFSADRPVLDRLNGRLPASLNRLCFVDHFELSQEWREADRQTQFAIAAACAAAADARIGSEPLGPSGAVYLSSSKGGIQSLEEAHIAIRQGGPAAAPADFLLRFLSCAPASAVAKTLGCCGPVLNFVSACASGAHSIMMGSRWVREHPDAVVFAGAAEASLTPLVLSSFFQMGVLATENGAQGAICRPFDRRRSGFIPGEGSAVIVLESLDHARRRGARVYAEVAGSASTADATHPVHFNSDGESIAQAIRLAARSAEISVDEIDYVNLHATGTRENDRVETRAIKKIWEKRSMPALSGTKPVTGHLLGAAGAVEAAITILALQKKFVPPTVHLEEPDPECDLDYTAGVGRPREMKTALSLSYGFGGQIAALLFRSEREYGIR